MTIEEMAQEIDRVEAELVRLQSGLWRVRQALQQRVGKRIGHQYDDADRQEERNG